MMFLSFGNLFAKEYDSTHELPEVRQPDKHRVYLRITDGYGNLKFPVQNRIQNEVITSYLVNDVFTYQTSGNYSKLDDAYSSTSGQRELEYRYMDKFRFFIENRNLANIDPGQSDSRLLQFRERYNGIGVGYFHPLSPNLNVGVSLRQVDIEQLTKRQVLFYDFGFRNFNSISILNPISREFTMRAQGITPGIHLEFKPLRWFEIHFGRQMFNLSGTESQNYATYLIERTRNIVSQEQGAVAFSNGTVSYTGEKSNLDFVFRFSSWFATKWGYSIERYTMKYKNYAYLNESIASSLFYSAIDRTQKQSFQLDSINLSLEFSKSFGE